MAEEEPKGSTKKSSALSGKFHGVPKPVIAVGGGILLYLGYRWYKNRSASSASTASTTGAGATPVDTTTGTGTGTTSTGIGTGGAVPTGAGVTPPWVPSGTAPDWSTYPNTGGYPPNPNQLLTTPPNNGEQPPPVGTTKANGAINPAYAALVARNKAIANEMTQATAAHQRAIKSGNAAEIRTATANLHRAQATVNARNAAAGDTGSTVTSAVQGTAAVSPITYDQQVAASGSGTGKSAPTGLPALTSSNGGSSYAALVARNKAIANEMTQATAAHQRAIKSGNAAEIRTATANLHRAQATVNARNKAA